jgi:TatD DNase family protein
VSWADSHCHLPADPAEAAALVAEAQAAGVSRLVTIGTDAARTLAAIANARAHADVWATAGLHPHDATDGIETLSPLFDEPEIVAVGECGLDYHYDHSPREVQRAAFAAQIAIAHERALTLVVHTREAWDDTFEILEREAAPARTVFHCFTGGADEAERALGIGAYLSFSGIVTFKRADDVRAAAAMCPRDRMLVETDAPFLAPAPHRGKPNRPAFVPLVGAAVAAVRGVDVAEVEAATWANTERVFALSER